VDRRSGSGRWSSSLGYRDQLPPVAPRPSRARTSASYSDALIKSSQRLRERSVTPPRPPPTPPTPNRSNLDYYRGMTKSVYEKEPLFRDFARNIPLSQSNLYDNNNISTLKRTFDCLLSLRQPHRGIPDPLAPSQGEQRYRPRSADLEVRQRAGAGRPCALPYIYVYHRN